MPVARPSHTASPVRNDVGGNAIGSTISFLAFFLYPIGVIAKIIVLIKMFPCCK
ncbi:hypothetical protein IMPR6_360037 [Imperialibacter sp. EC-SDR9]|nr:hypothetical protein IMPERIA75_40013 [Imperialibacter sp. 75]VVT22812.1 hypothetical protein IMPR6_360037 [Imperialibacter sp. EC-SDR9]